MFNSFYIHRYANCTVFHSGKCCHSYLTEKLPLFAHQSPTAKFQPKTLKREKIKTMRAKNCRRENKANKRFH